MFTLEQKVDIILRYIASTDRREVAKLKRAVIDALKDSDSAISNECEEQITNLVGYEDRVNAVIAEYLKNIGMPPHLIGYEYSMTAIRLCLDDRSLLKGVVTKQLYPDIAKTFDSSSSRVERGIRHAIEVVFDRGDPRYISEYFGGAVSAYKGKLTNREFLTFSIDIVSRRLKELGISKED